MTKKIIALLITITVFLLHVNRQAQPAFITLDKGSDSVMCLPIICDREPPATESKLA